MNRRKSDFLGMTLMGCLFPCFIVQESYFIFKSYLSQIKFSSIVRYHRVVMFRVRNKHILWLLK